MSLFCWATCTNKNSMMPITVLSASSKAPQPGRQVSRSSCQTGGRCQLLAGQEGVRTDQAHVRRPGKRLNSPERWEITQLIKAGVLDVTQYPTFDEEGQVQQLQPVLGLLAWGRELRLAAVSCSSAGSSAPSWLVQQASCWQCSSSEKAAWQLPQGHIAQSPGCSGDCRTAKNHGRLQL